MNTFNAFLILFLIFSLFSYTTLHINYQIDKGRNLLAKVLNPIIISLISINYLSAFVTRISWLSQQASRIREELYTDVLFLPASLNFILWFVYLLISLMMLVLCIYLNNREEHARKLFLKLIPFISLIECSEVNRNIGSKFQLEDQTPIFLLTCLFIAFLSIAVYVLYSSNLMMRYYKKA